MKTEYQKSITHIGSNYGYSPSNYSWTFKKHHRVSPAAFRRGVDRFDGQIEDIFSAYQGLFRIWLAAPLTEALTLLLSAALIRRSDKVLNGGKTCPAAQSC